MAFATSNVNNNEVGTSMEENNGNEESKLCLKQEPIDLDEEQKSAVIHSMAGDIRIACIYSGLEAKIKLENTNVQINDISMDDETLFKLEQRKPEDGCIEINAEGKKHDTIVKTEVDETNCIDIKTETFFPNGYKDDAQGVQENAKLIKDETDVINISAKNENLNLEIKQEPSVKTESDEEDMKFESQEEFFSEDGFLSYNECGEDNENLASSNTNGLSSSEDEDTTTASLNENLKKLVQFDNPLSGNIIDIYKNYDELWDINKLENLHNEKKKRLMQDMCAGIKMILNVELTSQDLEVQFDNPILGDIIDIYKNYDELWDINKLENLHNEKKKRLMHDMCAEIGIKLNVTLTFLDLEITLAIIHKQFSSEKKRRLKCELKQQEFTYLLPNFYRCDFLEDHQGPFRCRNCNAIIKEFQQFQEHKSQHETNECDICGKVCKSKRSLKGHKLYQHKVILYICELCNVSFIDEKSLKYHRHFNHCKCEACGKNFPNRKSMKQHYIYIHTVRDEKSLQCKVCGKISHNLSAFNNHKLVHSTLRHNCPICKKSFKQKSFYNHKLAHSTLRYDCPICKKSFKQKTLLNRHKCT